MKAINRFNIFTMLKSLFHGCVRDNKGRDVKNTIIGKLLQKFGFLDKEDFKHWKNGEGRYSHIL